MLANLVDGADIGMIQCRRGAGFAQEALISLLILGDVVGQKFEGDESVQLGILGPVDYTHATTAQLFQDPIVGNRPSDDRRADRTRWRTLGPNPRWGVKNPGLPVLCEQTLHFSTKIVIPPASLRRA